MMMIIIICGGWRENGHVRGGATMASRVRRSLSTIRHPSFWLVLSLKGDAAANCSPNPSSTKNCSVALEEEEELGEDTFGELSGEKTLTTSG